MVVKRNSGGAYVLQHPNGDILAFNSAQSHLKLFLKEKNSDWAKNEHDQYEIDSILSHRQKANGSVNISYGGMVGQMMTTVGNLRQILRMHKRR